MGVRGGLCAVPAVRLGKIRLTCVFTVTSATYSCSAISVFERPCGDQGEHLCLAISQAVRQRGGRPGLAWQL